VEVVFGVNKRYAGLIKRIVPAPGFETKDIINIIDKEPIIFGQQLELWEWMSHYYMCSEGEVMAAALPAHLKLSSESVIQFNDEYGDDFSALNDEEYIIAEALLMKKELRISEVKNISNLVHVYPALKRMVEKGVCYIFESLDDEYKPKKETFIRLNPGLEGEEEMRALLERLDRAPKQMALLLSYLHLQKTEGEVIQSELLKKSNAAPSHLKGLLDKGVLIAESRTVDRVPTLPKINKPDFQLSDNQAEALKDVTRELNDKKICLIHGITGSGKTMLYMQLIHGIITENKQALYLLPEITLTTQVIRKLRNCFGGNIAIYHSKFNNKERMEIWDKVKNREVKVVIGARSALFLPFRDLGLIIIDEEQDTSYKQQEPAPRYNARDAAIFYSGLFNARVVLGTATPSLETYYNTEKGKYGIVRLEERYGDAHLPEIEIVDMKTVMKPKKEKVIVSPALKDAMENALKNHHQTILFQNRRGYSPFLICGMCGYIPKCVHCDVSLTLHKSSNKLHCHYCGTVYSRLLKCPACGSSDWRERNFGTEKIEEEILKLFPHARVARMDIDSVRGKHAHDELIKIFEQNRIDILVGTQMVVKGLDFDNVMLIGVPDADALLNFADFRVNERAFQLMEQVSGRAGRKEGRGKVLIQAVKTDHPVLSWVKAHDYALFYENEKKVRKQFFYPPFSRIIKIILKHKKQEIVHSAAQELAVLLQKYFAHITGPAEPVIGRIRNQYLMDIMLKLAPDRKKLVVQKETIKNCITLLKAKKQFKSVVVIPDVDPY
jgi:primosomal protein N' (replication factor Y)